MNVKSFFLFVVSTLSLPLFGDAIFLSKTVRQRWPFDRKIDIDYLLSCDPSESYDIIPRFYDGDVELSVEGYSLEGDLWDVSDGAHRITFVPSRSPACSNITSFAQFRVELSAIETPLYAVVDIRKNNADENRITYLKRSDILSGNYGTWTTNLSEFGIENCSLKNPIIWTGVTNDTKYVTTHVVLRRIPAGSFSLWESKSTTNNVFLTKPYYLGVFTYTQGQQDSFKGSASGNIFFPGDGRPVQNFNYQDTRGSTNAMSGINWPETGYLKVNPESLMGTLRSRTGLCFDLPTEAQWEYAYHAGTTTYYYDGITYSAVSNVSVTVGRNKFNGGYEPTGSWQWERLGNEYNGNYNIRTAWAGMYRPNAFGLYDMGGNVEEFCLNYQSTGITYRVGTDPIGPTVAESSTGKRYTCGGSLIDGAEIGAVKRGSNRNNEASSVRSIRFAIPLGVTR